MIRLLMRDGSLWVDFKGDPELLAWNHRTFFKVAAEYAVSPSGQQYILSDKSRIPEVLLDTVGYLRDEGVQFECDDAVSRLIEDINTEQREYRDAARAGLRVQRQRTSSINPPGLVRHLKPYQERGCEHLLAVKHGANFSVPGSGKTTVVYAVLAKLKADGIVEKLLVFGPRSCFLPWEEEATACFGREIAAVRLTGPKSTRQSAYLQSSDYDLFLCTYQTAANDIDQLISLCQRHKFLVVVDESHNIKRLDGGVWAEALLGIARYATRRAILSGTPVPNDQVDLWTQFTFLWPGQEILGDRVSYRYKCENSSEIDSIRDAVRPFFFRTRKQELGLPPPKFQVHRCRLAAYQASIYRALSVKFLQELDAKPEDRRLLREWRKAKMVRLIQTASNPALLARYSEEFDVPPMSGEGSSIIDIIDKYPRIEMPVKFRVALRLVESLLKTGNKVVLWTSFVHNLRMLKNLLGDERGVFMVYGAIPRDESEDVEFNREQQIRSFKEYVGPSILLANPAACAESISLHKVCHHAIYLDRTFNCGQYLQSLDRLHRIGLDRDEIVTYHLLIAVETIDETVSRRLKEKERNMLRMLEDDLPIGTFEVEEQQLGQSESEEGVDFLETIKDIRTQLGSGVV